MPVKKGTSKAKAPVAAESKEDCCGKCDAKIEVVELKIADLEKKLKGLLDGIDAASKLKAELDEAKLKLGSEVNELKEKAKSWKEKADTNNDGKVDFEEVYGYVRRRLSSRNPKPRK